MRGLLTISETKGRIAALTGAISDWEALAQRSDIALASSEARSLLSELEAMSQRLERELMKVGLVGPFSSGKTLLVSALLDQVNASQDSDGCWTWESALLPSETPATSSYPLTIQRGESTRFWVRFAGESSFVERRATREVVRAYISDLWVNSRPDPQAIAELCLETPDLKIPAVLLDLPGTQSPRIEDDEAIARGLIEADCFLFVLSAAEGINRQGLNQLADLHKLYLEEGKPVFFVLTHIDSRLNRSADGRYAWEASLADTSARVSSAFTDPLTNLRDEGFIGRGFIPVATPSRAKVKHLAATDQSDRVAENEFRLGDPSKVAELLAGFCAEVVVPKILENMDRRIDQCYARTILALERVIVPLSAPIAALESQLQNLSTRLLEYPADRQALLATTRISLARIQADSVSPYAAQRLREHLQAYLEPLLKSARGFDDDFAQRVEIATSSACALWSRENAMSQIVRWNHLEPSSLSEIIGSIREIAKEMVQWGEIPSILSAESQIGAVPSMARSGIAPRSGGEAFKSTMEVGAAAVTLTAGAGAGAALVGVSLALPVAAVAMGGYVAIITIRAARRRRASVKATRESLEDYLDQVADSYVAALEPICVSRRGAIQAAVAHWSDQFEASIVEQRRICVNRLEGNSTLKDEIGGLSAIRDGLRRESS